MAETRFFPPGRAPYAADPGATRGRAFREASSRSRNEFQRDRDRIIHSTAFRRLALKTQVFLPEEGDHYRTRLTHTIEVAQITRTITRALGLDDDLGEALALAHDLGHTPFGHTGEDALDEGMATFGGFDHNAQTVRILTLIERRYPDFPGLNLTWDTIEGLLKRGGRAPALSSDRDRWHLGDLPGLDTDWADSFERTNQPSGEAQAAALADDIAYNAHDLEDGLQAGLFGPDELDAVPVLAQVKRNLLTSYPGLTPDLLIRGMARELVGLFVEDAIAESRRRFACAKPSSADDLRALPEPVVALSPKKSDANHAIKTFLFARMYRHPRLLPQRSQARAIVADLTAAMLNDRRLLPEVWQAADDGPGAPSRHARRVADYIAGMTDRFATAEHRRLFDGSGDLG